MGTPTLARTILPTLHAHTTVVAHLAFDTTGRTLVSGGGDGKVRLWRLPPGLAVLGGGQPADAVALSGDGKLLAAASSLYVSLFDLSDPTRLVYIGGLVRFRGGVNTLAFSTVPGGSPLLATGDSSGDVRLWDLSAPARPAEIGTALPGQTKPVSALAFDAGGKTLFAASMSLDGGSTGGLRAWNVAEPARPAALGGGELDREQLASKGLAARSGRVYASEPYGDVRVWRTGEGTGPELVGRPLGAQTVMSLDVHPRSALVATAGADSRVRLWDVSRPAAPKAVGDPLLTGGAGWSVGFSPDGATLASGNGIGQVRLWNTSDPARATAYGLPLTGHTYAVRALRFSPRGGVLVTAGQDGTVRLWQTDPAAAKASLCASTRSAMTADVWKEFVSPALPYDPPCGA
ncbi:MULTISPECIES: WD40 repeat domain-containing protein [unclassified Streptomyces]|uniref:WD40 repeat domain-containing protein n=1 Tax=Streptomyces sp. NPDC127129 TaxID=3345373 RepID=UPI003637918A